MKKSLTVSFVALIFAIILSSSCSLSYAAPQQVIRLKYASFAPANQKNIKPVEEWCKEVEKRTNGRVKVDLYPGGTLVQPAWAYDGIIKGITDMGDFMLSFNRGSFPFSEVLEMPLGMDNPRIATKLFNEFYKKFRPKELGELKILYFMGFGPQLFHTRKPVDKLEDLRGMKIRCGGLQTKLVNSLGATPVSMPLTDAYDALQKGVADGIYTTMEALFYWKLADVVKYTTVARGASSFSIMAQAMNKKKWDSLPPDIQQIIDKINEEWIERQIRSLESLEQDGREFTLKKGNKIVSLSEEENIRWSEKTRAMLDDYVKEMKAKGLPGAEAVKFCTDYIKTYQK